MFGFLRKKKHIITKPRLIAASAIVVAVSAGFVLASGNGNQNQTPAAETVPEVRVERVGDLVQETEIQASGIVKPATQVDIVAQTGGTVQNVSVVVGQEVVPGTTLARLYDATVLTNLNNALTSYNNAQLSSQTTIRLAEESVRQAQVGLQNAEESLQNAQINVAAAQNNLDTTLALQQREVDDLKQNSAIAISGYLNTVNNTLEQVNYILKVEGNDQLPGIAPTLGAKDPLSVNRAEESYEDARDTYRALQQQTITQENATAILPQVVQSLRETLMTVEALTTVLNNTVSSKDFTDAQLVAQKNATANLRSSVVTATTQAEGQLQTVQNQPLKHKQQRDSLQAALDTAKGQLALAELGKTNAQVALSQAEQSRDSQVIGARSSLDSARGQLSLVQSQADDLQITTPIAGKVISKNIELGTEVQVGTVLFSVAQSDLVKVEIELTSDEVYAVTIGQEVLLNNEYKAVISNIDPTADSVSRKVGVEIIYDNADKKLIPETFVDVTIPLDQDQQAAQLLVPLKAVTITQTDRYVMIAEGTTAKRVSVEIGDIVGSDIEILSDLAADALLIVDGSKQLQDGDAIYVK